MSVLALSSSLARSRRVRSPSRTHSGNINPASSSTYRSPLPTSMQFIPISPNPPSGSIFSGGSSIKSPESSALALGNAFSFAYSSVCPRCCFPSLCIRTRPRPPRPRPLPRAPRPRPRPPCRAAPVSRVSRVSRRPFVAHSSIEVVRDARARCELARRAVAPRPRPPARDASARSLAPSRASAAATTRSRARHGVARRTRAPSRNPRAATATRGVATRGARDAMSRRGAASRARGVDRRRASARRASARRESARRNAGRQRDARVRDARADSRADRAARVDGDADDAGDAPVADAGEARARRRRARRR